MAMSAEQIAKFAARELRELLVQIELGTVGIRNVQKNLQPGGSCSLEVRWDELLPIGGDAGMVHQEAE